MENKDDNRESLSTQTGKHKAILISELIIAAINYIIITYALTNMAFFFHTSWLYILFFASEIWAFGCFWNYLYRQTKSKIISVATVIVCFLIHIGMAYLIGRISGTVVPFR